MGNWKRPESVVIPTVWKRFEGRTPLGKNGKIPKFKIQDFTEDLRETVKTHMATYFLRDEPMCQNKGVIHDPVAVEQFKELWGRALDTKIALVCLLENKNELGDESLPIFVGCNLTHYMDPDFEIPKAKSERSKPFFDMFEVTFKSFDCCKHYNVDGFMHAFGLSVDPVYRGQGVGLEFMKARFDIGRAVGLKLTVTLFSAIESQTVAKKAGFETCYTIDYCDFKDEKGDVIFKGMKPKSSILMAARIE